jgi:hypothetical protein
VDKLQLLGAEFWQIQKDAGYVAPRPSEGFCISAYDGVALQIDSDDGDCPRGLHRGTDRGRAAREDDVRPLSYELSGGRREAIRPTIGVLLNENDSRGAKFSDALLEHLVNDGLAGRYP